MSYRIQQPSTDDQFKRYYHLRWKILREPWGQAEGTEKDNIENQCFHVMALITDNEVIGVARLQFNSTSEAQIRYMAVDDKHQGTGIGRALVSAIEKHAIESGHTRIILDARENAVNFYQALSYQITGKSYLLFDSIQHFKMLKEL